MAARAGGHTPTAAAAQLAASQGPGGRIPFLRPTLSVGIPSYPFSIVG